MKRIPLWAKLLGVIVLLAGACTGLAFVPTGEVAYIPHKPIDLDGRITIDNRPAQPLQGHIALVGVTEQKVSMLRRILLGIGDRSVDFGPEPEQREGSRAADAAAMVDAQQFSAAAAFRLLGEDVTFRGSGATVEAVQAGGPAQGLLEPGDIIVRVNGIDVGTAIDVIDIVGRLAPGSTVKLGVRRAGVGLVPSVRTVPPLDGDTEVRSRLAVVLDTAGLDIDLPATVAIDAGKVVGPSAGLAFALYLFDSRSQEDLLRGRYVVATGTVSPDGSVNEVGRIRQKAIAVQQAGREIFIVPEANAKAARKAIDSSCSDGDRCARIVGVDTVAEAVDLLRLDDSALDAKLAG